MSDETLTIRYVRLCQCGKPDGHDGACRPGRQPRHTGRPRDVLAAITHAEHALETNPGHYHARRRAGDTLSQFYALPIPAPIIRPTLTLNSELHQAIRQVLANLELTSNGSVQAWNASGGHSGEPDDKVVNLVIHPPIAPHHHYRFLFTQATSIDECEQLLTEAQAELASIRRRTSPNVAHLTDREILDDRIINEGHGCSPADVALALFCTPRRVQQVRIRDGRNPLTGHKIVLDDVSDDAREHVRTLIAQGMTERQVFQITGVKKTTIRRICGRAA